jgi:hypothetical protein
VCQGCAEPRSPLTRAESGEHRIRWTAIDVVDTVAAICGTWPADVVRADVERRARYATIPLTAGEAA